MTTQGGDAVIRYVLVVTETVSGQVDGDSVSEYEIGEFDTRAEAEGAEEKHGRTADTESMGGYSMSYSYEIKERAYTPVCGAGP